MEFEDREDLTGQQASKLVIPEFSLALWWANKELHDEKLLSDYCGKNDRTKLAVKIQRTGMSAPARFVEKLSLSLILPDSLLNFLFNFFQRTCRYRSPAKRTYGTGLQTSGGTKKIRPGR